MLPMLQTRESRRTPSNDSPTPGAVLAHVYHPPVADWHHH